jgi:hypothetical protein
MRMHACKPACSVAKRLVLVNKQIGMIPILTFSSCNIVKEDDSQAEE